MTIERPSGSAPALAAAGVPREQVVRTRMYVVDSNDQVRIGAAHAELFAAVRPVATMVEVEAYIP